MLKNILKTSISAFVLLGTLSSLDSSYAMDEEKKVTVHLPPKVLPQYIN